MSHVGDRASALVDGQLSAIETDRILGHLAGCRPCRDAVDAERQVKALLAALNGPQLQGDLMARLISMGGPVGPLPPREGLVPGTPRPAFAPPVPALAALPPVAGTRPPGRIPAARATAGLGGSVRPPGRPGPLGNPRRARFAGAVIGAIGVVGAGVGGLSLAGPITASVGQLRPAAAEAFLVQRSGRAGTEVSFGARSDVRPVIFQAPVLSSPQR